MSTENYTVHDQDDRRVIQFNGQLHAAACGAINDDVMNDCEEADGPLTFDLEGVTFASSSFLRIVLAANRLKGRTGFAIVNVQPDVKKVFKMAGLWDALNMSEST